jgi:hypothetical protein
MESDWEIVIFTGPLDKEWLVAEIYYKGEEWSELTEFGEKVTLFARNDNTPWVLPYDEVIQILNKAKNEVMEKPSKNNLSGVTF